MKFNVRIGVLLFLAVPSRLVAEANGLDWEKNHPDWAKCDTDSDCVLAKGSGCVGEAPVNKVHLADYQTHARRLAPSIDCALAPTTQQQRPLQKVICVSHRCQRAR